MAEQQPKVIQALSAHLSTHAASRERLWAEIDAAVADAAKELEQERQTVDAAKPDFQPPAGGSLGPTAEDT